MRTVLRMLDRLGDTGPGLTVVLLAVATVPMVTGAALFRNLSQDPFALDLAAMCASMGWIFAVWAVGSDILHWASDRLAPRFGLDPCRTGKAAVAVCFAVALAVVFAVPDLWAYRAGLPVLAWAVCFPRSWEDWIVAAPRRLVQAATAARSAIRGP